MTRTWSNYQQAIFDFVKDDNAGNAIVEAVAGSGKSTTIVEAFRLCKGTAIFLAFNKSIADELKERKVNARTFHSMVFSKVMEYKGQKAPVTDKLRRLFKANTSYETNKNYSSFACKLVGLARNAGVGFLVEDAAPVWKALADHHDLEPEKGTIAAGIIHARDLFQWSNESEWVDFDDMLYIAAKEELNLYKYDFVFVDEAQDTNAVQRAVLKRIMKPGARIIAVGDPAQAIYGFRGADSAALGLIAEEFEAKRLPLSISYRCPTSVVKYAQQWCSHIEAAPTAEAGAVHDLEDKWTPAMFDANALVVCRKTAPLIQLVYRCIKEGKRAYVMGKEIGQGLHSLVKKMGASNIDGLIVALDSYKAREVAKMMEADQEEKAAALQDKVESLLFIIDILDEQKRTLDALAASIDYMFESREDATRLATIHKAKGLEADNVFWLERSACPSKWAKQEWQQAQERNICYVAATRAKKALYLIEPKQDRE